MGRPEASYAAALLATTENPPQATVCGDTLLDYARAMETSPLLRRFLLDPALPKAAQKDVLAQLAPPGMPQNLLHLLWLLADKGRLALLPKISVEYRRQRASLAGGLLLWVRTARPLDDNEIDKIKRCFMAQYGAQDAVLEIVLDPGLIGGVRIQVGDTMYDQSLFGRMEGLRRAIGAQIG